MQTNPNIILSGNQMAQPRLPDVNAMMQTRTAGLENIYNIEQQRAEQQRVAAKEQEAALVDALAPAYATAFKGGGSKEALTAAYNLLPPEIQAGVKDQIDKLMSMPSDDLRLSALEASMAGSDAGRTLLNRIPTEIQRMTADIQRGQLDVSRQRLAQDQASVGMPKPMTEYEANVIRLREQEQVLKAEREAAIAAGEEPSVALQKGETWNPDTQQIELVKGSKLYNDTAKKHNVDYKEATTVADKVEEAKAKIDYILSDKQTTGFEGNFGGYNAAYASQYFPGQTQDVKARLESLKSDLKNAGLELLRTGGSIGQITEREWPIIEQQLANLTPYISEQEARDVLTNVRARLDNIVSRAAETYDMQWSDTQFYKPVKAKTPGGGAGGGKDTNGDGVIDFNDLGD